MELKADRVSIEKTFKKMREDANNWVSAVCKKEKEVIGIIKPTEEYLNSEKKRIDLEIELEKTRIVREKQERLQKRVNELNSYNSEYNVVEV